MGDMTMHSDFAPSSMDRLEKCPGSYSACLGIPSHETDASIRGTELHQAIAQAIREGAEDPSSILPDVRPAWDFYQSLVREDDISRETEVRVSYKTFSGELYYGTADLVITRGDGSITVVDWKFGRTLVPAIGNLQLAAYACAIAQERRPSRVDGVIFQPMVSEEPAAWEDIPLEESRDRILSVISGAKEDVAPLCPGEHCRFCPAFQDASCPAIRTCAKAMGEAVSRQDSPLGESAIAEASEERLEAWMRAVPMVEAFIAKLKERVLSLAKENGGSYAGCSVKRTRGRLRVTNPAGLLHEVQALPGFSEKDILAIVAGCASVSVTSLKAMAKEVAESKEERKELDSAISTLAEAYGTRGEDAESLVLVQESRE